jgi:hypothetical protein
VHPIALIGPFQFLSRSIAFQEAGLPDVGHDDSALSRDTIEDSGILHVLSIVRAGPDLIEFAYEVMVEELGAVVLDGFDIDVQDVPQVEFDDLGAHVAKVCTCFGVETHTDFDEEPNFLCGSNDFGMGGVSVASEEGLAFGTFSNAVLEEARGPSEGFKEVIEYDDILGEAVDEEGGVIDGVGGEEDDGSSCLA